MTTRSNFDRQLEALHLDYPPQSWRWLDSINADGLAEIAAAQGVKL